ncbi:MAG TPA: hypothetical protein VK335_05730 [Bryobacteraceae bacterium]|nr:hypothetical protein [Bryobacteraceae bacterium]
MNAAVLLALFAPESQTLTDEVFQIPAKEWRYVDVAVKHVPVTVDCEFHVTSSTGAVRVELVNAEGLNDWKQGHRDTKDSGAFRGQASFSRMISVPDDYAVVVENSGRSPATVRLRVSLDASGRGLPQARYLSPQKRLVVIAISATVFLAIVSYSAKKLLTVMRG